MEGVRCVPVPQNQANPFREHVLQTHVSHRGSEQDRWIETSPGKRGRKTASPSLIYETKKPIQPLAANPAE